MNEKDFESSATITKNILINFLGHPPVRKLEAHIRQEIMCKEINKNARNAKELSTNYQYIRDIYYTLDKNGLFGHYRDVILPYVINLIIALSLEMYEWGKRREEAI